MIIIVILYKLTITIKHRYVRVIIMIMNNIILYTYIIYYSVYRLAKNKYDKKTIQDQD